MAKSPLSKGSTQVKTTRSNKNVVQLNLTIPYKQATDKRTGEFDISHLAHMGCDKTRGKVQSRMPYLRRFCKKAHESVLNGNSPRTVAELYGVLRGYLCFCDAVNINPLSEKGYLKYAGNDGELRHRVKVYNPSKRLWEKYHYDELGIKESTASLIISSLSKALSWCGLPSERWTILHRPFNSRHDSTEAYSDADEKIIVTRLSDLFFGLASQLIALKTGNTPAPNELPICINFGEYKETLMVKTDLKTKNGFAHSGCAFNLAMGAAYHLMCYFTSLNDSDVRKISHPITVHADTRDKSLQTVKVSSFKARANKEVGAILTNESDFSFDVEKKSGVMFIKTLAELSTLYGEERDLLFTLDTNAQESHAFNIKSINRHLTTTLNLVSSERALLLPWFQELFYSYFNHECIGLKKTTNELGRAMVSKITAPITNKARVTSGLFLSGYCILSCYTDQPLKGIILPLSYSEKDKNGNVTISFHYQNGDSGHFVIPAADKALIKDIELWATKRADNQLKTLPRFLLKKGNNDKSEQWEGINPISANLMSKWAIKPGEYFINLTSSRFRETTSSQEYQDGFMSHLVNLLQNTLETLNKHYANGNPKENKIILSQALRVLERMAQGDSLEEAKDHVQTQLGIPILAHDEWLKSKKKT
ncbi:hypothetical protein, partial [Vibrio renipiscarius]